MLTSVGIYRLIEFTRTLSYIFEKCRIAKHTDIDVSRNIPVKGRNFILEALQSQLLFIDILSKDYPSLKNVKKEMNKWSSYLNKKYSEKPSKSQSTYFIKSDDAEKLEKDVQSWIGTVENLFGKKGTIYLPQSFNEIFKDNLLSTVDDSTRRDIYDAFRCINYLIPTPAAMIALRAAESIVRIIYKKTTNQPPEQKSWFEILKELENSGKLKSPLIGYLHYLRDKRNEAEHPDKRFDQEESEQILIQIKGLLKEIKNLK